MPNYPLEAGKLLQVADTLAPENPGPGRPSYTHHRRAVSTAYYALFHAISDRVAAQMFPAADNEFRQEVRRWIGHGDVRWVSTQVSRVAGTSSETPAAHIRQLLAPGNTVSIEAGTVAVADDFLRLNDRREAADYDHSAVFSRNNTRALIATARRAVDRVATIETDHSEAFFGLIGFQAKIGNR